MHHCPECGEACHCFDGEVHRPDCVHDCDAVADDGGGPYRLPDEADDDDEASDFSEEDLVT